MDEPYFHAMRIVAQQLTKALNRPTDFHCRENIHTVPKKFKHDNKLTIATLNGG